MITRIVGGHTAEPHEFPWQPSATEAASGEFPWQLSQGGSYEFPWQVALAGEYPRQEAILLG